MNPAGKRDRLITFQRATPASDGYGGETLTWADLFSEWAKVFYGTGAERRDAAAKQGEQSAVFQVLLNENTIGITVKDRIQVDGETWGIVGKSPMNRSAVEFTGVLE